LFEPFNKACFAFAKGTPVISNKTTPILIGAHQYAIDPLPLPILFSVGVWLTGICGKNFIQIFPFRFKSRFIHCLTDSICLEVIRRLSIAFKPINPCSNL
jgi:hypothetical protein